jgi:hypothetical protein
MVLKRSVGGLNTGNTISPRYVCGHQRLRAVQFYIYKYVDCYKSESDKDAAIGAVGAYLTDGLDHVCKLTEANHLRRLNRQPIQLSYSLNKRKRWLLPSLVQEAIDDVDVQDDESYRLVLHERSVMYRTHCMRTGDPNADCVGYHDSKLEQRHVYPARRPACYTGNVVTAVKRV